MRIILRIATLFCLLLSIYIGFELYLNASEFDGLEENALLSLTTMEFNFQLFWSVSFFVLFGLGLVVRTKKYAKFSKWFIALVLVFVISWCGTRIEYQLHEIQITDELLE